MKLFLRLAISGLISMVFIAQSLAQSASSDPKQEHQAQGEESESFADKTKDIKDDLMKGDGISAAMDMMDLALSMVAGETEKTHRNVAHQSYTQAGRLEGSASGAPMFELDPISLSDFDGSKISKAKADLDQAIQFSNEVRAEFERRGIDPDDVLNNPENYLSAAQLAAYKEKKGELFDDVEKPQSEKKTKTTAMTFDTGMTTQGGVFAPNITPISFDSLFNHKKRGIRNSAHGYYGNVKLETLAPESDKSLFERVSLKMKSLM